jgi:2-hydroxychromene-2-carboxylate isomerase
MASKGVTSHAALGATHMSGCRPQAKPAAESWPSGHLDAPAAANQGVDMTSTASLLQSQPEPGQTESPMIRHGVTIYGSFEGPWSYLASRRADLLRRNGVTVDWRAVEPVDGREARAAGQLARLHRVRAQLDQVLTELGPGERLPYSLGGFVPGTTAAVLAYAGAYRAGVAAAVRPVLFEALWLHGVDLGDGEVVRALIADAWPGLGPVDEEPVSNDFPVAAIDPLAEAPGRLRQQWRDELSALDGVVLPVLVIDGRARLRGGHAVGWLGEELVRRGVDPAGPATADHRRRGSRRGPTPRGSGRWYG